MKKIKGRLEKSLGSNDLRVYLSQKNETSMVRNNQLSIFKKKINKYCSPIKNPKVLLISPPITIPKYMQKRCIPPLGISYVAASLRESKIDVEIFDCCVEGWEIERESKDKKLITYGIPPSEIFKKIDNLDYDVVGVSVLFSTDLLNLYETTKIIKKNMPNAIVVVGGLHPTIYPEEVLSLDIEFNKTRTIDFIIRGEGEFRLVEFLENLKNGNIDLGADGLVGFYNNQLFVNSQIKTIEDIDQIPFPAFDLLPIKKYFKINIPFSPVPQGDKVLPILTTRGCPIGCSFCANTNTWKKHRKRSIENVISELKHWKKLYDIDEIQFADDNLTFDMEHAEEKFSAMKGLDIIWCTPNGTMINKLTENMIKTMADSGMYQITLSLDSANVRTLKELHHKPVNLNSIPGLISKCRELGIFTHGTLVVGMPGETMEEIRDGFEYVKEKLEFTSVSVFIAAAIPGSELYHQMLEEGKITKEDARTIDTTKSKICLSNINSKELERTIESFQEEYLKISKRRAPKEYERKYKKLIDSGRWDEQQIGGKLT